jgi:hypothetical protein
LAIKTILIFSAFIGKQARRVFPIEVYEAKHGRSAVRFQVIYGITKRASKFLESITTWLGWVLGSFALVCEDTVVQIFKAYVACCK